MLLILVDSVASEQARAVVARVPRGDARKNVSHSEALSSGADGAQSNCLLSRVALRRAPCTLHPDAASMAVSVAVRL